MQGNWNQVFHVDGEFTTGDKKDHHLIQFGIVELDLVKGQIIREAEFFIIPAVDFEIGWFCKKLTGIDKETVVKKGISFKQIHDRLHKLGFEGFSKKPCLSWGPSDGHMINKACTTSGISNPFQVFDISWMIKNMFGSENQISLKHAKEMLGIQTEQTHSAVSDARDSALVHLELVKRFRSTLNEEIKLSVRPTISQQLKQLQSLHKTKVD